MAYWRRYRHPRAPGAIFQDRVYWRRRQARLSGLTPAQIIVWGNISILNVTEKEYAAINLFIADIEISGEWELLKRLRIHWIAHEVSALTCVVSGDVMTKGAAVVKAAKGLELDGSATSWLRPGFTMANITNQSEGAPGGVGNSLIGAYISDFSGTLERQYVWSDSQKAALLYNYDGSPTDAEVLHNYQGTTAKWDTNDSPPLLLQDAMHITIRAEVGETDPFEWWQNGVKIVVDQTVEEGASNNEMYYGNRFVPNANHGFACTFGMTFMGANSTDDFTTHVFNKALFYTLAQTLRTSLGV